MSPRQAGNLSKCVVDELGVERAPSREEPVLVAEGAMMRAASRDDNRVRHQVSVSLNEISPYGRKPLQSAHRGFVAALRSS